MDWETTTKIVVEHVTPVAALFLTTLLSLLAAAALRKLSQWLGVKIDDTHSMLVQRLAIDAVGYAEEQARRWAKNRGEAMPSEKKLDEALRWAMREAERRGYIDVGKARLEDAIHAWLGGGRGSSTSSEPARITGVSGPTSILLVLMCFGVTLAACSPSALGLQADLIAMGGIATSEADKVVVEARARELDQVLVDARTECGEDGCDTERAVYWRARLDEIEGRWAPAMACRAPVVESLRAWADGLATAIAAETDELGLELLIRLAGRFVSTWAALERCVEAAAPDVDVPGLPRDLAALVGGAS